MGTSRYVLLERIGVGGMAEVFRAMARGAEGFERPIAIKRILPHLAEDSDFVRMFVDEAKIAVQLQHPNIVQILDLGRDDREYFIAMEYVQGKDLRALQDGLAKIGERLPPSVAIYIAMKVCEALHHAHFATGHNGMPLHVVHRDVTPQNVMLSYDGEVKVTDFGLARAAGRATQTQAGVIKGKLAYMAPEAFTGAKVDLRGDVFGVGVLLWEMLTGRRLFLGKNDLETVQLAQAARVPPLRSLDPHLPRELEPIVARALERDRERRYQTAEELHDDLEAFAYSSQLLVTSGQLGAWLRERFPPPDTVQPERAPDVATREIRLGDVGSASRSGARATFDDPTPQRAPPAAALKQTLAPQRPRTVRPSEIEELLEDDEGGFEPEPFGEESFQDVADEAVERDTVQPPAPEPFDDTTGRMAPRAVEVPTVQRYDRELSATTVPRAPAVPIFSELGWEEGEDLTEVSRPTQKKK